jgi:hypothetical protein
MSLGRLPRFILLEDAEDLTAILVMTSRTISPLWADDVRAARDSSINEQFAISGGF